MSARAAWQLVPRRRRALARPRGKEEGPTACRLHQTAEETAIYLAKHKVESVLVTTTDGELIGLCFRDGARSHTEGDEVTSIIGIGN